MIVYAIVINSKPRQIPFIHVFKWGKDILNFPSEKNIYA